LIGENGSGKTAILEAIAVGMGCFFSGIPGVFSRHIRKEDLRYFKSIEGSYEYANITKVEIISAEVMGTETHWNKSRNGQSGSNVIGSRSPIWAISNGINHQIRDQKRKTFIDLPVLAYYSTARLWKEGRENKRENIKSDKSEKTSRTFPSRYRGYRDALEIKSTFKIMLEWFKGKFSDLKVNDESSPQLDCVRNVILENIPGARSLKWVFNPDRIQTLYIVFNNGDETPFHFLSDGYRNLLAIFADLAYRCVTLNPHFGKEANLQTNGMVLIDELDLHLHPSWQKTIIGQLKRTFPQIQFVATTHSPFVIQGTDKGELFRLQNDQSLEIGGADDFSLEDVAEYLQDVPDPAWSIKKKNMYEASREYFRLLDRLQSNSNDTELNAIRERLNILGKAYSDNVAYTAFLEQKRFMAEQGKF
jgi:predicted ATP-binding protein involved in virulence